MVVSLDGYIEGPRRELDWFLDGDPQFEEYCDEMLDSVGLALYGRRAYEVMVGYWPQAEAQARTPSEASFAQRMNALPKLVLSSTLQEASWSNARVLAERIPETIRTLKQQPGKPIVAWAGAGLVSTLAQHDLIDEYRLLVHPVLLGAGTPLFRDVQQRTKLQLTRTTQLGRSVVVLCYEPTRAGAAT